MQSSSGQELPPQKEFLQRLRSETSTVHTNLEELSISQKLTAKDTSLKDYVNYLQAMYSIIRSAEINIYPILETVISDIDHRYKASSLQSDIEHSQGITSYKEIFKADSLMPVAYALGIMYVIEGSTLGGRIILKNLPEYLNLRSENRANFFEGYGEQTSAYWKSFIDEMSAYAIEHKVENVVIKGAQDAFEKIYEHLSQYSN